MATQDRNTGYGNTGRGSSGSSGGSSGGSESAHSTGSSGSSRTSQQVRDTVGQVGHMAEETKTRFQEGMNEFRERFDDVRDTVVDKTKEYARVTNTYVNDNPWVAVGISTGIGFLLGMMISNRRGSNLP